MIRINFTRQNSNHPDRRKRHPSRASCEVGGQRYETTGPAPIYKLLTLLWLHGHGSKDYEAWDDVSPFGKPGGLALRGPVRNWARIVKGKPSFDKDAPADVDFSLRDRELIAQAAGRVIEPAEIDSPRPDNARTGVTRPPDGPEYPQEQDRAPAALVTVRASAAA